MLFEFVILNPVKSRIKSWKKEEER